MFSLKMSLKGKKKKEIPLMTVAQKKPLKSFDLFSLQARVDTFANKIIRRRKQRGQPRQPASVGCSELWKGKER